MTIYFINTKIENLKAMKKLFALIAVGGFLTFGAINQTIAQDQEEDTVQTEQVADTLEQEADTATGVQPTEEEDTDKAEAAGGQTLHKQIKEKFIEGGPPFMGAVLLTLIFGLAIALERIIYLNLASTNTKKLLQNVEDALNSGGIEAAKEVCRNTKGPVASIFYQGLDRYDEGIEVVEKSVQSYGSVQMGLLEKGLTWISLFIAIAPMLGFMGTVIGMIDAFDTIEQAGDISPSLVAGGIKIALITTVSGLIVAVILQIFYNYIMSKIDNIVNDMEDSSISMVDMLVKYKNK
jgi:biopolymer transport protein ExbB